MNATVPRLLLALVLAGLVSMAKAEDASTHSIQATPLIFTVTGTELGLFPVVTSQPGQPAVTYDLTTGLIEFMVGTPGAERYMEPLFCFDMGQTQASAVSVMTRDVNAHQVVAGFGLGTTLNYLLSNDEIRLQPAASSQCFYRSANTGEFGLFGRAPTVDDIPPAEWVFSDRFQTTSRIGIEFVGVPAFMNPGEPLSYQLIVSNEGNAILHNVALQELYPRSQDHYLASLTEGDWGCAASGGAQCPAGSDDPDNASSLRFSGLTLPVGGSLTFNVSRTIRYSSLTSTSIDLHAGVVAGGGPDAAFDVAEHQITIIGEGQALAALNASARAGEPAFIEVFALDANKLPVPFVDIQVDDAGGLQMGSTTETTSVETGSALFSATATAVGQYTVQFSAEDMGTTTALVDIEAADPASVAVSASTTPAVADGIDTVSFNVLVHDQFGNPTPAILVSISDDGGLADISSKDAYTNIDGIASFSATSTTAGQFTVEFTAQGIVDSATVSFQAGEPAGVVFTEQPPKHVIVDEAISPPVVVRIVDANDNWVEHDNDTDVMLWLYQNGALVDQFFGFDGVENGEVVFDDLEVGSPGNNFHILALAVHSDSTSSSATSNLFQANLP